MAEVKRVLKKKNWVQAKLSDALPVGSKSRAKMRSQIEPRVAHGGVASVSKRKTSRPFSSGAPVHLVLRSARAKGLWSLKHRKNLARVNAMVYTYAKRFKVEVFQAKNTGKELHLLVKAQEKKHLADFLRVLAGRVAVVVSGAKRYVKRIGKFWDYLYWSKIVNWGSQFFEVRTLIQTLSPLPVTASGDWNAKPLNRPQKE